MSTVSSEAQSWWNSSGVDVSVRALSISAVVLALGLSGCGQSTSQVSAADPASACASATTLASLKGVVLATSDLPENAAGAETYRDQIVSGAELKAAKPSLALFDKPTSTITCTVAVTFVWPKTLAARLATISPNVDWTSDTSSLVFSLQSKAGVGGFDVAVQTGSSEVTGTVQSMVSALYQSDQNGVKSAAAPQRAADGRANAGSQRSNFGPGDAPPADAGSGTAAGEAQRAQSGAPRVPTLTH
jgi:hypothetical protein